MNRFSSRDLWIGHTIQTLRFAKNLTQEQLADELGIKRSSIAQWETGNSNPRVAILHRLAEALGVEAGALLSGPLTIPHSTAARVIQAWERWEEIPTDGAKGEFIASIMHLADAVNSAA